MSQKGLVKRRGGNASMSNQTSDSSVVEGKDKATTSSKSKSASLRSASSIFAFLLVLIGIAVSGCVWWLTREREIEQFYPSGNSFVISGLPEYIYDRKYPLSDVAQFSDGPLKIIDSFVLDWPAMKWTLDSITPYIGGAKRRVSGESVFPAIPQRKPLAGNTTYAGKDASVVYTPVKKVLENMAKYTHVSTSIKSTGLQNSIGYTPKYIPDQLLPSQTSLYAPNTTVEDMEKVLDLRDKIEAQNLNVHETYYGTWRELAPKVQGETRDVHILSAGSVLPLQSDHRNRYFVMLQGSLQAQVVAPRNLTAFRPHPWISSFQGYYQDSWASLNSTKYSNIVVQSTTLAPGDVQSVPDSYAVELRALKQSIFLELGSYSKYKRIFEESMQKWMMTMEATWTQRQRTTVAGFAFQHWLHNYYVQDKLNLPGFSVSIEKPDWSKFENDPDYIPIATVDGRLLSYVHKNTSKVDQIKERTKSQHKFLNITIPTVPNTVRVRDVVKNPSLAFYDQYVAPMYQGLYNDIVPLEEGLLDPKIHPHTDKNAAAISRDINMDGTRVPTLVWLNEYAYCNMTSDLVTTSGETLKEQLDMATKFGFIKEGAPEPDQKYLTTPQLLIGLNAELRTYVDSFKALPHSTYPLYMVEALERIAYWATNDNYLDGTFVPRTLACMAINLLDF